MEHPISVDSECVGHPPQSLNSICTRIVVTDLGYLPPLVESVSIPHSPRAWNLYVFRRFYETAFGCRCFAFCGSECFGHHSQWSAPISTIQRAARVEKTGAVVK